jgi:hypothetical protein
LAPGVAGPKAEAEEIKAKLQSFLRDRLNLELSAEKTLITHAGDKAARFLGTKSAACTLTTRETNVIGAASTGTSCSRFPGT